VRRLAKRHGVAVTGWVPDARPYLDRAEIFVAPLRMACGVQNKLLEVLAMGLPCVASAAAWRGIVVPAAEGILATTSHRNLPEIFSIFWGDSNRRAEMAGRARAAAEQIIAGTSSCRASIRLQRPRLLTPRRRRNQLPQTDH
jgi:glycosyltransferase involved in cell wall biosynthesis